MHAWTYSWESELQIDINTQSIIMSTWMAADSYNLSHLYLKQFNQLRSKLVVGLDFNNHKMYHLLQSNY